MGAFAIGSGNRQNYTSWFSVQLESQYKVDLRIANYKSFIKIQNGGFNMADIHLRYNWTEN